LLHAFEGWVVFMASLGVLLFEMWVLGHIGGERRPFREVFGFDFPAPTPPELAERPLRLPAPFIATLALLVAAGIAAAALPSREEVAPARPRLSGLPMQIGDWHGRSERLDRIYIDALKLDDYVVAEYTGPAGAPVELYVAYYASQRKGASVHSPRTCIPGGGWEIRSLEQRAIPGVTVAGQPLRVNRVQIQKGDQRQLVYYWFQQRGRVVTNEYLLKWYLFWDALTRNRTDGALVRLSTAVAAGENLDQADRKLVAFAKVVEQPLRRFIPE
jgi:EpsI family protein